MITNFEIGGKLIVYVALLKCIENSDFIIFKKWANPGLFLFIFVLFNNNFTEKL